MHDIEPFYIWMDLYNSTEDERSPFFGQTYNEFEYEKKVYNYFIHPHWDEFGAENLFLKIIYSDYEEGFAIIEFIGEWNDALGNDIMFLKRDVIEKLMNQGIFKFITLMEHVLNFHASDDSYYEEWNEEVAEENGWICFINTLDHVSDEMKTVGLQRHIHFGKKWNDLNWRKMNPNALYDLVLQRI